MANAFRASETAEIGGEEYTMFIDIAVIDAIEDELDADFLGLMARIGSGMRLAKLVKVIHGLLTTKHPELHIDETTSLTFQHGDELVGMMERLFAKAWPDQVAGTKGENPRKARRGTGASSSSNGARKASRPATSGSKRLELSPSP